MNLMSFTGHLSQFTLPGSHPLLLLKGLIKIHIFSTRPDPKIGKQCAPASVAYDSSLVNLIIIIF